ncbi:MAG: AmmeMemoRadiSam system radical SAM enzyme [Methanotrichaceae archaeon]|nr:AmmeMemoRadiSam system radical SAM enzyme [Methanotrichaceae archaeon]
MIEDSTREALFWHRIDGDIKCELCHQQCRIGPGKRGLCGVRENQAGKLMTLVYGNLVAANVDPIEKKPLYHFLPGSLAYSIATVGCNFRCLHCQNADISQLPKENGTITDNYVPPQMVVENANDSGCQSIAYTYTEPTIFFEYAYDVSVLANKTGLKNVFVSNGYIGDKAVEKIMPILDGINIDLKGDEEFYKKVCGARIEPVQNNIRLLWESGVWVEVTTLIIPGYNDSGEKIKGLAEFLASVSTEIPWHVTAFYPTYKMRDIPPTSKAVLRNALKIGTEAGLKYIYAGNVLGESENTICPICGEMLIERVGYRIIKNSVAKAKCPKCSTIVPGVWS